MYLIIFFQIYLYEYTEECEPSKCPRQCLPYAIIRCSLVIQPPKPVPKASYTDKKATISVCLNATKSTELAPGSSRMPTVAPDRRPSSKHVDNIPNLFASFSQVAAGGPPSNTRLPLLPPPHHHHSYHPGKSPLPPPKPCVSAFSPTTGQAEMAIKKGGVGPLAGKPNLQNHHQQVAPETQADYQQRIAHAKKILEDQQNIKNSEILSILPQQSEGLQLQPNEITSLPVRRRNDIQLPESFLQRNSNSMVQKKAAIGDSGKPKMTASSKDPRLSKMAHSNLIVKTAPKSSFRILQDGDASDKFGSELAFAFLSPELTGHPRKNPSKNLSKSIKTNNAEHNEEKTSEASVFSTFSSLPSAASPSSSSSSSLSSSSKISKEKKTLLPMPVFLEDGSVSTVLRDFKDGTVKKIETHSNKSSKQSKSDIKANSSKSDKGPSKSDKGMPKSLAACDNTSIENDVRQAASHLSKYLVNTFSKDISNENSNKKMGTDANHVQESYKEASNEGKTKTAKPGKCADDNQKEYAKSKFEMSDILNANLDEDLEDDDKGDVNGNNGGDTVSYPTSKLSWSHKANANTTSPSGTDTKSKTVPVSISALCKQSQSTTSATAIITTTMATESPAKIATTMATTESLSSLSSSTTVEEIIATTTISLPASSSPSSSTLPEAAAMTTLTTELPSSSPPLSTATSITTLTTSATTRTPTLSTSIDSVSSSQGSQSSQSSLSSEFDDLSDKENCYLSALLDNNFQPNVRLVDCFKVGWLFNILLLLLLLLRVPFAVRYLLITA